MLLSQLQSCIAVEAFCNKLPDFAVVAHGNLMPVCIGTYLCTLANVFIQYVYFYAGDNNFGRRLLQSGETKAC